MRFAALALALTLAASACGETVAAFQPGEVQLVVELTDYKVVTNVATIRAGETKIGVRNRGSQPHDLVLLRTDLAPDKLPYDVGRARADEPGLVARTKELRAGGTAAVTATLEPGQYVIICNVAGHYGLGMRTSLRVE
ncbi:MAG TPA: plastocyanin/azurin family copper-binding protein [Candidatus Limnocylindria bacterium]|nr:plastocyanin/azurin family copper-binding protein [Candidatus Limnocylindria bacterium]